MNDAALVEAMGVHGPCQVDARQWMRSVTLGANRLLPLGVREDARRPTAAAAPPLLPPLSPVCCASLAAALAACLRSVTSAGGTHEEAGHRASAQELPRRQTRVNHHVWRMSRQ